jgi:plastocyanin
MKKISVIIFVLVLLAAGSYYFFLNYPATTYAILGLNNSANSTPIQINTSTFSNATSVILTNDSTNLNLASINTTSPTETLNTSVISITSAVTSEISTNAYTYNITIINFAFYPNNLTIHKGDTVLWINKDGILHRAVSDNGNEIDSSDLTLGLSYAHTFGNAGNFSYHDFFHPTITGIISVK